MLDPKLADDIIAAVEAGFAHQVKLTQDLVRYPSLRGQEHTAQDFLYQEMARRGLTMDRWAIDVDASGITPASRRWRWITATPSTSSAPTARASPRANR